MKAIVKLAVFGAILYVALVYGKPWLEELLGSRGLGELGGGGNLALACVASIERVNEAFTDDVVKHGQPPVDFARWAGSYRMTEGRLRKAEITCDCSAQGCATARQGLQALARSMSATDLALRNDQPRLDLAREQEEILELLDRARAEAR